MGRMWTEHTREHKGSAENNALRNGQADRQTSGRNEDGAGGGLWLLSADHDDTKAVLTVASFPTASHVNL